MQEIDTIVYAGRLKNKMELMNSSSGGAFIAVSDYFLDNNNAVVCAVYDYESHATEFHLIESKEERNKAYWLKVYAEQAGTGL